MAESDNLLRNFQIILPARLVEGETATAWVGGYVPDPNYDNTISYSDPVFSTSDDTVATVNTATGEVTAIKAGLVTITAKIGTVAASTKVTVVIDSTAKTAVDISVAPKNFKVDQKSAITVTPDNTNNKFGLRTGGPRTGNALIVDNDGNLYGSRAGFDYLEGYGKNVESNRVWVEVEPRGALLDFAVKLTPSSTLTSGVSQASVVNENYTHGFNFDADDATWDTSDHKIATIDADGRITTLKDGRVTISCELYGMTRYADLIVTAHPLTSFSLTLSSPTIGRVTTSELTIDSITPAGAVVHPTYTSSRPDIARVDSRGNFTPISEGTTRITVTDSVTQISKHVDLVVDFSDAPEVVADPSGIMITTQSDVPVRNLGTEERNTVSYKIVPQGHPWSPAPVGVRVKNTDIASAVITGTTDKVLELTGVSVGPTELSIFNGGTIETFPVFISENPVIVTITANTGLRIYKTSGPHDADVFFSILPAGTSVTLTSSNDTVAKIVDDQVTIMSVGTADLTATAADGTSAKYSLTVLADPVVASKDDVTGKKRGEDVLFSDLFTFTDSTADDYDFTSDNSGVVGADKVTLVNTGTTKVTATHKYVSTVTAEASITGVVGPTVAAVNASVNMLVGDNKTIDELFTFTESTKSDYTLSANGAAVDVNNQTGEVTSASDGSVIITATHKVYADITATVTIVVASIVNVNYTVADFTFNYTGNNGEGVGSVVFKDTSNNDKATVALVPNTNLSNGDTPTIQITAKHGFHANGKDVDTSLKAPAITGLLEVVDVTITKENLTFTYGGAYSGVGTASVAFKDPANDAKATLSLNKTTGLSNGDTVTVTITAKSGFTVNGKATDNSITDSVVGLKTNVIYQAGDVTISLTGNNGSGVATKSSTDKPGTTVSISPTTGLSNDDVVTATITADSTHLVNGKATDTLDITVTNLPDAPKAIHVTDGTATVAGDATTIVADDGMKTVIVKGDADSTIPGLSAESSDSTKLTVAINADGTTAELTPVSGQTGSVTVTFKAAGYTNSVLTVTLS